MAYNVILRLRRDNDYNYRKIAGSFTPADGEICLVDTSNAGLRFKVGDGKTDISSLQFEDSKDTIIRGYYVVAEDKFYLDSAHTQEIEKIDTRVYVDASSSSLYYYDDVSYKPFIKTLPTATSETAGILKLYNAFRDSEGNLLTNIDGALTQKATIEAIQAGLKLTVNPTSSECITFSGFNIEFQS